MTTTELARADHTPTSIAEVMQYATVFRASGYFKDVRDENQAAVKIMAGSELGLAPFASMNGIDIIQGKPVVSAHLAAALVQRSAKYDYRVVDSTTKRCEIAFLNRKTGEELGHAVFDWDMAQRANLTGKDNWKKHPDDMLYARAMSKGVRRFCPDLLAGAVYVEGEIDGGNGDDPAPRRVDVEVQQVTPSSERFVDHADSQEEPEEPTDYEPRNDEDMEVWYTAPNGVNEAEFDAMRECLTTLVTHRDFTHAGLLAGLLDKYAPGATIEAQDVPGWSTLAPWFIAKAVLWARAACKANGLPYTDAKGQLVEPAAPNPVEDTTEEEPLEPADAHAV